MSSDKTAIEVFSGAALIAVLNALAIGLFLLLLLTPLPRIFPWITSSYGIPYLVFTLAGVSVYQLLYAVPLIIFLRRRGSQNVAKGVIVGAVLTALLCGGCFVVMFGPL